MPFPVRPILIAFGICAALPAYAKTSLDTIAKKMTVPLTRSNIQALDKINRINEGVRAIRADSVEKGVHMIAAGIDQSLTFSRLDRVMDYNEMEYIELLKILGSEGLSDSEKQLGFELYRIVIKQGLEPTEKNLGSYFKSAPNTLFVKRIRLMIHSNEGDGKFSALLNSLLKEQPALISLNILRAESYFNQNKFEAAIPYLDKVIALSPYYAYAYNLRARCQGNLNKWDQQIKDEDKAIAYFPNYTEAYYYRASAYEQLQDYRNAATAYLEVTRRSPGYQYTNYSISRCYKAINILDSALYFVNDYIRQDANDADGYYLKGDIYYDKDDYPAAVKCFDQAAGLDPKNAGIYQDRGNAYFYWGKLDTAITDFVKSASLDRKNPYPLERIGDCYYNMKDYDKSILYHQKALRVDPQYKYALVSIGLCYDRMEKHEQAADIYRKAISIDSTYGIALGNFGWENYCIGHFDDCISWSYKALQHDQAATYAMFNIALATLRKGEFDKAKDLYIHFISLCKEKNYEMTGGAQVDLRDLIKNKIFVDQAAGILKDVFHEEP